MANKKYFKLIICVLTIILSIFFIYGQAYYFGLINLDSYVYIKNSMVQKGLTSDNILWPWTVYRNPSYYMPFTWYSYLIDTSIYGTSSSGYRLTNIFLHVLNSLLIFYFVYIATTDKLKSFFVAILFAVHPQHVEAVVWIAERKEVLAAFFGLLSLLFYVKYVKNFKLLDKKSFFIGRHYYLLSLAFFIFSLLSKPMWITLPCILLLLDWWPLKKYKYLKTHELLKDKIPFFLISTIFFIVHYITSYNIQFGVGTNISHYAVSSINSIAYEQRFLNSLVIYMIYFWKSFFPFTFTGYQSYPIVPLELWKIYSSAIVLIITTTVAIFYSKRKPYLLFGWLWFLGTLFPCIGIINSGGEGIFIGDRWSYLPHIGLFMAIIWGITSISIIKNNTYNTFFIFLATFILIFYGYFAHLYTSYWRDSETLWSTVVEADENNHYAHYLLGNTYALKKELNKAITQYEKAHKINPDEPYYLKVAGDLLLKVGDADRAWTYHEKILKAKKKSKNFLVTYGIYYSFEGMFDRAEMFLKQATKLPIGRVLDGDDYQPYLFQSFVYLNLDRNEDAIKQFEKYLSIYPHGRELACDYAFNIFKEDMNIFYQKYCFGPSLPEIF